MFQTWGNFELKVEFYGLVLRTVIGAMGRRKDLSKLHDIIGFSTWSTVDQYDCINSY